VHRVWVTWSQTAHHFSLHGGFLATQGRTFSNSYVLGPHATGFGWFCLPFAAVVAPREPSFSNGTYLHIRGVSTNLTGKLDSASMSWQLALQSSLSHLLENKASITLWVFESLQLREIDISSLKKRGWLLTFPRDDRNDLVTSSSWSKQSSSLENEAAQR